MDQKYMYRIHIYMVRNDGLQHVLVAQQLYN